MSRLLGHGWSRPAFLVVCYVTAVGIPSAIAGHDHKKTTKYELVQGYILQPQSGGSTAAATQPAMAASPRAASPQSAGQAPPPPAESQMPAASPPPAATMTLQLVQAPVQMVQLQLQPAPTQTLQLAAAPMQTVQLVQQVQYQTVQMPTVSMAAQASAPSMVATPVQLLIPQRRCHFFGH
jgi:hypothetical protein